MLGSIKKKVVDSFPSLGAEYRARRRIAGTVRARRDLDSTHQARGDTVLLPASVPGSLGDAAMIEGLKKLLWIERTQKPKLLEYDRHNAWSSQVNLMPAGVLPRAISDYLEIADAVQCARQMYVNGADVLDGKYSIKGSVERLNWVRFLADAGCPVTVTGFSFRSDPPKEVVEIFRRLPASVRLCPRDPISYERLKNISSCVMVQVADLAFQMDPDLESEYEHSFADALSNEVRRGRLLVGVCLNLHSAQHLEYSEDDRAKWLIESMAMALEELRRSRPEVLPVLLPHDYRFKWNDVALGNALITHCGWRSGDYLSVDRKVGAAAIKSFCASLTALVSGRMHCGIAALGQGVPTALFDYQGKVKGLLDMFDLESSIAFQKDSKRQAKIILNQLVRLIEARDSISRQISAQLPHVLQLAAKNIA